MKINTFIGFAAFTSVITTAMASTCVVSNKSGCEYVVNCYSSVDSEFVPSCSGEAHTTLIIENPESGLKSVFFRLISYDFILSVREIRVKSNNAYNLGTHCFYNYRNCLRIDLAQNNIVTIEGSAFENLMILESLNLSGNHIVSLKPNSFYISSDKNNGLKVLDLSNNRLTCLDSEFNQLPNLRTLYLQGNQLSYIADYAFNNLKVLNQLYLQENRLTFLNNSLIHLKSLQTLNIANNHLTQLRGHEINSLIAIVDLNMSHNELISIEKNCFRRAFDLQRADFSYNQINITIGTRIFKNTENLKYLDFYSNNITGIQENAFQFCDLDYLQIGKNNITGDINPKTLSYLHLKTDKIDLSSQSITGIRDYAFTDMKNLVHLNLSRNSINFVENDSFSRSSITTLDLSNNMITNLDFLRNGLTNLIELYINNNNINVLSKNTFAQQSQLKRLDVSMSQIIYAKEFTLPLVNLENLNFVGHIEHINIQDQEIQKILPADKNGGGLLESKKKKITNMVLLPKLSSVNFKRDLNSTESLVVQTSNSTAP